MYLITKERNDEEVRTLQATKACKKLYATFYFIFISAYGWIVLRKTEYLPRIMGGKIDEKFDFRNMWYDFPVPSNPEYAP